MRDKAGVARVRDIVTFKCSLTVDSSCVYESVLKTTIGATSAVNIPLTIDEALYDLSLGASKIVHIDLNDLKPVQYEISDLEKFIKDVISDTLEFYKNLEGDDYIGIRSECESFMGQFQKYIYLNSFCKKKDINEMKKKFRPIVSETIKKYLNKKLIGE